MNGYAKDKKFDFAYVMLLVLSVAIYMILSVIANKTTSFFGIQMDAAALVFPVLYVISDIVSEVYGYRYSRILSFISAICGLLMFVSFSIAISLPDVINNEINNSFKILFEFSPFVIGICLIAYLVGDYLNDRLFEYMKCNTQLNLSIRSIVTSLAGHMLDSLMVFIPFAFVIWGYTLSDIPKLLFETILIGSFLKITVEAAFLPITIITCKKLSEKRKCRE